MSPNFSIIIPTYQRAGFLPTAINSVLSQTYQDYEIIIIDDGSTDDTKEVVSQFKDQRIRYFKQENKGRSAARNHGIERTRGKYICFLDDDDYYLNDHLESIHIRISQGDEPILILSDYRIERNNEIVATKKVLGGIDDQVLFAWRESLQIQSICIARSALQTNRFPEQFSIWEDKHFLMRLFSQYGLVCTNETTVVIVDHPVRSINAVYEDYWEKHMTEMARAIEDLEEKHPELFVRISKSERTKKKSESLVTRSLDALQAKKKTLAWQALTKATREYFHPALILTYTNTLRKLIFSS